MHLNYRSTTLATLFGLLLIISIIIVEIESCGGGKGGYGKEKKDWGKMKDKKKEKKAKSVMSGFMNSVASTRHHHRHYGYDDDDDYDYDSYVKSPKHYYREPKHIVETHYVEVPRYVERPIFEQQVVQIQQPYLESSASNNPYVVPYELQRSYPTMMPIKETIEYNEQAYAKQNWPSRHPVLNALFRKMVEN